VLQNPHRVAVHTQHETLTYQALNQAANRVAHTILARRGMQSEAIVLLLEKGAQLITAILGVLKAGKACVVQEPSFPVSAEVLNLDRVGIFDPFLDLGGHSLLATGIVARIGRTFRVELPVRTLLETPTVADMAVVIAQHLVQRLDAHKLLHQGEDLG